MKTFIDVLIVMAFSMSAMNAAAPETPKFEDFSMLLNQSPFGKKVPPKVEVVPVVETKTTLNLTGLSRLSDGWMVTLVDSTKPTERIVLADGVSNNSGVSVVEVNQDPSDYTKTSVVVKQGGRNFKVGFNMPEIEKNIARSVKTKATSKPASSVKPSNKQSNPTTDTEYQKKRAEMMKEAEALRKMRDAGNEGDEYKARRKALMEKANEMRSEWRQRRGGNSSRGRR